MKEAKIEVSGRVQGVNFRNNVKNFADKTGLKGYVLNREDGTVLIVVQGEKEKIESLISWIKKNPGFSKVEKINCEWKDSSNIFKEFRVQRNNGILFDKAASLKNLFKFIRKKNTSLKKNKSETKKNIPIHIAIIPDGNRRWAQQLGLESSSGHYTSADYKRLKSLFMEAKNYGVKYFSLWAFSTDNWKRDEKEIQAIFDLIEKGVEKMTAEAKENKIRFMHIGRKDRLPKKLVSKLEKLERETSSFEDFNVQLFIDYGGRDEIIRAINRLLNKKDKNIDEKSFLKYLDSGKIPPPDLIIRTGKEHRLSGFMLYQGAYAELYFSDVYFPDFEPSHLREAFEDYNNRKRRFGGN